MQGRTPARVSRFAASRAGICIAPGHCPASSAPPLGGGWAFRGWGEFRAGLLCVAGDGLAQARQPRPGHPLPTPPHPTTHDRALHRCMLCTLLSRPPHAPAPPHASPYPTPSAPSARFSHDSAAAPAAQRDGCARAKQRLCRLLPCKPSKVGVGQVTLSAPALEAIPCFTCATPLSRWTTHSSASMVRAGDSKAGTSLVQSCTHS